MKRQTRIALIALSSVVAVSGIAYAAQGYSEHRKMHRVFAPEKLMEHVDTDGDSAASREEMTALITRHFNTADGNGDGKVTKAEIVVAIDASEMPERMKSRSGRIADRMVRQGDINQDGMLELAEIENRVGKFHALADWNDDGRVEIAEAKRLRGGFRGHRRKHRD